MAQGQGAGTNWRLVLIAGGAVVVIAALAVWQLGDRPEGAGTVSAPPAPREMAAPPPTIIGNERTLLLHRIAMGNPSTAEISMEGVARRAFRVGEEIAPGLRLAAVEPGRATIDANGRKLVLTLGPDGRPGDRTGLDPEPAAMPQLSGAEIERRQRDAAPVRRLPEEEEAGAPK
ncbi:MAG TPA: hypothetical protein VM662_06855 [Sphingomonas sp.]|nr:hypothetical protein [Sphingomonas sp.]